MEMGIVSYRRKNLYLWILGLFCVVYIVRNEFSVPKCAEHTSTSQSNNAKLTQNTKLPNPRMISPLHQYPKVDFSENQRQSRLNSGRVGIRLPGSDRLIDHNFPILFIGGVPRSGTTIMRVIADAHPSISCGEETRVVPQMVSSRRRQASEIEKARLQEAGISQSMLDDATRQYILSILVRENSTITEKPDLEMLCDKDPFNLLGMTPLLRMFPSSKFILMIRDGRAVVHSLITRRVTIGGWNLDSYTDTLTKWSQTVRKFIEECDKQPIGTCMKVFYEQLVLQPNKTTRAIAQFLNVPWNDVMLHHQDAVGKSISVSKLERSTEQVAKPINLLGLNSWVGHIPMGVLTNIKMYAPMLETLGYDLSPDPSYGEPDEIVKRNKKLLEEHPEYFAIETKRFEKGKIVKGQQFGFEKMKKHQQSKNADEEEQNKHPGLLFDPVGAEGNAQYLKPPNFAAQGYGPAEARLKQRQWARDHREQLNAQYGRVANPYNY